LIADKKFQLFFALKTLAKTDVKIENEPGCPAQNQRAIVSIVVDDGGFSQCSQWFSRQIRSRAKVRLIK
jgi:hypothetical protein